jgi:hypothetical protein
MSLLPSLMRFRIRTPILSPGIESVNVIYRGWLELARKYVIRPWTRSGVRCIVSTLLLSSSPWSLTSYVAVLFCTLTAIWIHDLIWAATSNGCDSGLAANYILHRANPQPVSHLRGSHWNHLSSIICQRSKAMFRNVTHVEMGRWGKWAISALLVPGLRSLTVFDIKNNSASILVQALRECKGAAPRPGGIYRRTSTG